MRPARLQALVRGRTAPTPTGLAVAALASLVIRGVRVLAQVQEDLAAWPGDAEGG